MLFSTCSHTSRWVRFRFGGRLSLVVAHVRPTHHFALSRLANLTHAVAARLRLSVPLGSTSTAVCCASLTSNSSPPDIWSSSFFTACSYHGSSRRFATATGRVRLTLPQNANSCSCASSTSALASESHRIACGTWTRQLCAWFQKKAEYEEKTDRVHPHGPLSPRHLMSHSPTHWITQEAHMDMIDPIDADMHASIASLSFVVARSSPVPSLAIRMESSDQCDGNQCCPSFGGCLRWHHSGVEPAAQCASTRGNSPGSDTQ